MIDIVKALRSRATWETATGITEPHEHIDWMAAEEITILRGQVEALDHERNRLWTEKLRMQLEIARLREENARLILATKVRPPFDDDLAGEPYAAKDRQPEPGGLGRIGQVEGGGEDGGA